jgi:hypothetical protein
MTLKESTQPFVTLVAGSRAAGSANGTSEDLWDDASGRAREVTFVLSAAAGGTGSVAFVIEESDDNTTFTTVADVNIVGDGPGGSGGSQFANVTTSASFQERTIRPQKRWVRVRYTVTTGPQVFAVIGIAGQALEGPI